MNKEILLSVYPFKDMRPLMCGEEVCASAHAFGPATRDYYLLHYVMWGKGSFETPRGVYEVGKGDMFIIHPFEVTYYKADKKVPWHYAWVGFESTLKIDDLLGQDVVHLPQAEHIFRGLKESDSIQNGREFYVCGKIFELLGQLEGMRGDKVDQTRMAMEQVQNYISAHYMKTISVELLAQKVGLERSYFSRTFKGYIGKSPQQYLVDFRLEKAAELLSMHGYGPMQAAASVGYSDLFHFSKMFTKKFGVPPSRYMK